MNFNKQPRNLKIYRHIRCLQTLRFLKPQGFASIKGKHFLKGFDFNLYKIKKHANGQAFYILQCHKLQARTNGVQARTRRPRYRVIFFCKRILVFYEKL